VRPGQREPAWFSVRIYLQAELGVFEYGFNLLSGNAGEPGKKIVYARATFKIFKECLYRHPCTAKDPRAADLGRIALDG
jgi:hypothetical protein